MGLVLQGFDAHLQRRVALKVLDPLLANNDDVIPGSSQDAMYVVGGVEILAGLVVAIAPRFGGLLVAAWLGGIIVNLLVQADYYDIALRDFGLLLAALTLARLATAFDRSAV